MAILQVIFDTFGWTQIPRPLFYNCAFALRFELGGGLPVGPARFLQGMDRARQIAAMAFAQASTLTAAVPEGTRFDQAAVADVGFSARFEVEMRKQTSDRRSARARIDRLTEFPNRDEQLAILLWMSVAKKMGVTRSVRCLGNVYIVDRTNAVILHVYDDRGMDVAAADPSKLLPLYREFNGWLLDYDRQRMDMTFGSMA